MVSTNQGILSGIMFAYCENDPVNLVDYYGLEAAELLGWWSSLMWWLSFVDGPVPVGDIIYTGGVLVLGCAALYDLCFLPTSPQIWIEAESLPKADGLGNPEEEKKPKAPEIKYPGNDPNHKPSVKPHWDWNDGQGHKYRVFPDNRIEQLK